MTPTTSSSGLIPNLVPQQHVNPPTRNDWDHLFQPMFDEYFNPSSSVVSPVLVVATPRAVDIAGSPSSTTIDQDAPSLSTSSTNQQQQSLIISQGVEEPIPNALFDDPCHEPLHDVSTSQESSSNVQSSHSLLELIGFVDQDNPSHVYKLQKALYGLKQASRAWYDMLSSFLISQHFSKRAVDPTLFTRKVGNDLLLVQIYVDDIIFASTNTAMCDKFTNLMTTKFKMSMMGKISFFLDTPMVEKNKLDADLQGTPVDATHYRGMIGSLMYMTSSRPDLIYAVCLCARYQENPTEKHLNAVKRIFRYLKGTINMGLWHLKDTGDKLVSWSSKKQKSIAISSTEAEYIALYWCCAQILWMRSQLTDYGFTFNKIPLYCDNKSAIALC
ncbi:retrovirus-related pol polyprotein from transposon TNT 1-94 [Tanacetum coccineum]